MLPALLLEHLSARVYFLQGHIRGLLWAMQMPRLCPGEVGKSCYEHFKDGEEGFLSTPSGFPPFGSRIAGQPQRAAASLHRAGILGFGPALRRGRVAFSLACFPRAELLTLSQGGTRRRLRFGTLKPGTPEGSQWRREQRLSQRTYSSQAADRKGHGHGFLLH